MRWLFALATVVVASLISLTSARSSAGNRLLVVLDDVANKDTYSVFWDDLKARQFDITFSTPKSDPNLFLHGERAYDHLLLLPSKLKALGSALTPTLILDFLKADGNVLLALSSAVPTPTSLISLLLELDIHLHPERNAVLVDHFNYDVSSSPEKHDVLLSLAPGPVRNDVKDYLSANGLLALPRCVGQTLGTTNPLLTSILKAPTTAYSYDPSEDVTGIEDLFAPGQQMSLVSAIQTRNSARFTVLGSAEMLQNSWFEAKVQMPTGGAKEVPSSNRYFASRLSSWTFKEVGVLKVTDLKHHLSQRETILPKNSSISNIDVNPKIYRIKTDVTFTISLSEYSIDEWVPFRVPIGDAIQLEFSMLSPYHRLTLNPSPALSTPQSMAYSTTFTLPDQHGIFNFRVNYKRPFLSNVDEKRHVTVRHFAHDEWPRSWKISGSWVWIAGIWGTVAGWLAFVLIWLYSEPTDRARSIKKTN